MRKAILLIILIAGVALIAGCGGKNPPPTVGGTTPADRMWAKIVPPAGTATDYGIPISFANTRRFISWYTAVVLSPAQAKVREEALAPLAAPCCDDYPMSTCCCVCNLSRSVWGLSAYLIRDKGYTADQVRNAALQWLHFIRPDYYVARALKDEGRYLARYGVSTTSSCFANHCDLPFYHKTGVRYIGGCGGMDTLVPMRDAT